MTLDIGSLPLLLELTIDEKINPRPITEKKNPRPINKKKNPRKIYLHH